jgi:pimeloyl-ACP methyl ester carboxylesterase
LLVLVATIVVFVGFHRWRQVALKRLVEGSHIAETRCGPVEYATMGEGPALVVLHGGMGGWDQGMFLAEDIAEGFTVIAPSRGGYLRTPLSTGKTPEEVADSIIGLLDTLGVETCGVLGVSGGGPTALAMTLRHPQRVRALSMASAISGHHEQPELTVNDWMVRILFSKMGGYVLDLITWFLFLQIMQIMPRFGIRRLFNATEELRRDAAAERVEGVMRSPTQRNYFGRLFECSLPLSVRKIGLDNDIAQFARLPIYPVEEISCPTLVIHGRHDGNVPFSHALFVADGVPNVQLFVAETCGHLIWMSDDRDATIDCLGSFFRRYLF